MMFSTVQCLTCGEKRTAILELGENTCELNCVDRPDSALEKFMGVERVTCTFEEVKKNAKE